MSTCSMEKVKRFVRGSKHGYRGNCLSACMRLHVRLMKLESNAEPIATSCGREYTRFEVAMHLCRAPQSRMGNVRDSMHQTSVFSGSTSHCFASRNVRLALIYYFQTSEMAHCAPTAVAHPGHSVNGSENERQRKLCGSAHRLPHHRPAAKAKSLSEFSIRLSEFPESEHPPSI